MTSPAAITTADFNGTPFGPQVIQAVISAIIGGAPFADSLTRQPTSKGKVVWPVVDDVDDPSWVEELGLIPILGIGTDAYVAAVSKLAGIVMLSIESVEDADFSLDTQVRQILQDTFSAKLDRDMFTGAPAPAPSGVIGVAPEVTGADLELAAITAKAQISTAGGQATHIAVNATALGAVEAARDGIGRPLYPDAAARFAGLTTVLAPAATQPLVYDKSRLFLVVRKDFAVDVSREVESAFTRYAMAMRVIGRFGLACPQPARAVRKLVVADEALTVTAAVDPASVKAARK